MSSGSTGWDPNPARYFTSNSLTGPWFYHGNPCEGVNPANGLTAIEIEDVVINTEIQEKLNTPVAAWKNGYAESKIGDARFMIINAGHFTTKAFVYLREDDSVYKQVTLLVKRDNKEMIQFEDNHFPFEFTLDVTNKDQVISLKINGITNKGQSKQGEWIMLSRN